MTEESKNESSFMKNIKTLLGNLEAPIVVGGGVCEGCNCHYSLQEFKAINNGQPFLGKVGCRCETKLLEKEMSEHYYKMKDQKKFVDFEKLSAIPKSLQQASFKNYHAKTTKQLEVKQTLLKFSNSYDNDKGVNIILAGNCGIGKSHLGVSICKQVTEKGFSSIFIDVPRLLSQIRSSYGTEKQMTENSYLTSLEKVDFLVLDDFASCKETDWATEKLFIIMNARQGKNTMYTTNKTGEEIVDLYGERILSRMITHKEFIFKLDGEDMRKQA